MQILKRKKVSIPIHCTDITVDLRMDMHDCSDIHSVVEGAADARMDNDIRMGDGDGLGEGMGRIGNAHAADGAMNKEGLQSTGSDAPHLGFRCRDDKNVHV